MYGKITKFRPDIGCGIISAENGRKYRFARGQVLNSSDPLVGEGVDFELVSSRPAHIIMMAGSPWTAFGGAR